MKKKAKLLLGCLSFILAGTSVFAYGTENMYKNTGSFVPVSSANAATNSVTIPTGGVGFLNINSAQNTSDETANSNTNSNSNSNTSSLAGKAVYYDNWSLEEAQAKIDAIGKKLIANNDVSSLGISFSVSNERIVNAYTDGRTKVVIFTGLLELCESEDELAFILGHEIAHIRQSHLAKRTISNTVAGVGTTIAKNKLTGIRSKVANVANQYGASALGINPDLVGTAVDTVGAATTSAYERRQETDADTVGMDIINNAGYNPLAGIAIIYRMGDNYNDLFEDHPSTDKRVVKMYNYCKKTYPSITEQGYNSSYYKEAVSLVQE